MKKILFTLILSLALQSCDWIKSLGPEETFFCKINGQKFRPDKDNSPIGGWGSKPLEAKWIMDDSLLTIGVRNNPLFIGFNIKLNSKTLKEGEFILSNELKHSIGFLTTNRNASNVIYYVSTSGKFVLSEIDGYNISGTFEFVCKDSTNNKEYRITEGEFNKLSYY
ncbi:hypothetical protein LAG90_14925 [Marinilongibacter aquaticus]|uniref:DUF6252 family protein n=1 Tax=Marinilongibacter aquaticus TaxID=2975157 RepID=UPI0021BDBF3C|nr:DUF6252 family protein [Marinilongibacter aquaticus]UBM58097.1 hypothetical protein LAG90_14925 [Marinilongibacter aquaticus]